MGEFDTAAFTDSYRQKKMSYRLHIKALADIESRVKTLCLNYAIKIEKQIENMNKSERFLQDCQNELNNYFKINSENIYNKLLKASDLIKSVDQEDYALLLAMVRKCINSVADHFYPPKNGKQICSDGKERLLGNEQYLNRIHEYLAITFNKSTSKELLISEFEHLAAFARKINDIASKGVHSDVTMEDGKLGLICLYIFLYNIIVRISKNES